MIDLDSWPGDRVDGRPCCLLRRSFLSPQLLAMMPDRRGYGIPSHGLPQILQGFGLNGWRVVDDGESLSLQKGLYEQANEHGCRDYLAAHAGQIVSDMEAWRPWLSL